tara:strand:+ start:717 stop:2465 length:1749 start_codon:yes stop_codon:yes gene_type:complete
MKRSIAITLVAGVITLGSCSGLRTVKTESSTQLNGFTDRNINYNDQMRFKSLFFESQRLKSIEEFNKATKLMEQCLSIDPLNADAHYEMACLYLILKQNENALFHAKKSNELNPTNIWVTHLLSQIYQLKGNLEGEISCYKDLIKHDPSNADHLFLLARAYSEIGSYKKAIQVYNTIESLFGVSEDLSVMKEYLYITMGNVNLAAAELKKLIDNFPNKIEFKVMLAELYKANNLTEKSIIVYNNILSLDPKNMDANIALAEYYRLKNDYLKAFEYLTFCFDNLEFDVKIVFQILSSYFQLAIEEEKFLIPLQSLLNKALINHPSEGGIFALAGDLYFQLKDPRRAFDLYESALNLGLTDFLIWSRYLILGLELEEYEIVYTSGLRSIELHPIQPSLYLFTSFACSYKNENEQAIRLLKKGVNYVVNNNPLKADFYNYLGDAYHAAGLDSLSDENYQKSLDLIPENPIVLNNYSYYLSLRGESLDRAERMSRKCIELDPDQATYQDTYGWILYKLKRFKDAEEWLKKAVEGEGENAVILEHYGDVLFQVNRKTEAIKYWNRSKHLGGESELLNKKIREGMLYE